MKKPREYKADEFSQYCDDRITKECYGKLVEEQNKPYPDGSLCLGYYNSIKICDWYLNDNKECEE